MRQKLTLLLLAAAALVAWLLYSNVQQSRMFRLSTIPAVATQTPNPTVNLTIVSTTNLLQSPRFTGQDAQNRSWEITAAQATQHGSTTSTTLHLTTISATLNLPTSTSVKNQPTPITLTAQSAEYTQSTQHLMLQNNVVLKGQGLTLQAPTLHANLTTQTLTASGGIRATLQLKQNKAQ